MCQSQADGGKRCAAHSVTGRARRKLKQTLDRLVAQGDTDGSFEVLARVKDLDQAAAVYGDVVTPMDMDLPDAVHDVFAAITADGFKPTVVGGSVCDAKTDGRPPKDVDVEIYGATLDEVNSTDLEAVATKCFHGLRHEGEISGRIGVGPPRHRIGAECQRDDVDHGLAVLLSGRANCAGRHGQLLLLTMIQQDGRERNSI